MSDSTKQQGQLDLVSLLCGGELSARISFEEMYFLFARFAAARSKDPRTQCGACIVLNGHVVGTGYNGFTLGMPDYKNVWETKAKYMFVEHAERNAIHNSDRNRLAGSTIYIWTNRNYPPCPECGKAIIQSRIKTVCLPMRRGDEEATGMNWDVTREMFRSACVEIRWQPIDINEIIKRACA